ncbi:helix-turn-helix domain-containing protein [Leucobacter allii]|uniref:Helix-turn-helix domain-containing protein n=1 Tax=Leucobacter allii TaxID=2932247 RepID=A0ABY4FH96_9MICO|nr:helix-turn-helix domain-containing protein [Leucobacter allii]UOQ56047.1 helix-turn-helix domain-containing protein [Leucobacter allii]
MPDGERTAPLVPANYELLTLAETAAIFRKSVREMRWARQQGDAPPSAKIGGRIMFRAVDVHAFIDAKFNHSNPN